MTNKEAREILERYISCSNNECPPVDCDECQDHVTAKQLDNALQVALEALQEPEKPDHIAEANKKDDENGDDLIRREDALMSLTGEWKESRDEILSKAIRRIKRLPSVQQEPQWIPCSERMPVLDETVLATTAWDDITIAWRVGIDEWRIHEGNTNAENDDLIAWLPLPYPYKPQQEDNT